MLSVAAERWLVEVGDHFTKQTTCQHRAAIDLFARSRPEPIPVGVVTRKMVGAFVSEVLVASGRKQATVNRIISSLSALWRWLVKRGFVEANPWVGQGSFSKRPTRGQRPKRPYSKQELLRLLGADPGRVVGRRYGTALADLMRLGLLTGARLNELCELSVEDVLEAEQAIRIREGKTENARRVIPVHTLVWPLLLRRLRAGRTGCSSPSCRPVVPMASALGMRPNGIRPAFPRYGGLQLTFCADSAMEVRHIAAARRVQDGGRDG